MRISITVASVVVCGAVLAQGLVLSGCHAHAFSPPARGLPLETSATLSSGQTGLAIEGGTHGEVFGPTLVPMDLRSRHGVGDDMEFGFEGSVIHITDRGSGNTHPNIYGLRAGGKYALIPHLALGMGLGGGASAAGPFVSPDVELIGAYENRYVVPFASVRAFVSVPIAPGMVDLSGPDDPVGSDKQRPDTTGGFIVTAGARLPIGNPEEDSHTGAISAGIGATYLNDTEDNAFFLGAQLAGEVVF